MYLQILQVWISANKSHQGHWFWSLFLSPKKCCCFLHRFSDQNYLTCKPNADAQESLSLTFSFHRVHSIFKWSVLNQAGYVFKACGFVHCPFKSWYNLYIAALNPRFSGLDLITNMENKHTWKQIPIWQICRYSWVKGLGLKYSPSGSDSNCRDVSSCLFSALAYGMAALSSLWFLSTLSVSSELCASGACAQSDGQPFDQWQHVHFTLKSQVMIEALQDTAIMSKYLGSASPKYLDNPCVQVLSSFFFPHILLA